MRWEHKARLANLCARAPFGASLYLQLQRRFGGISSDPFPHVRWARDFAAWAESVQRPVTGAAIMEVGTGHKPIVPIVFALLGAESVSTFDLYRRIDWPATREACQRLVKERDMVCAELAPFASREMVMRGLDTIAQHIKRPGAMLKALRIAYRAPGDARATGLAGASVDLHVSTSVFEHIPPADLRAILAEARRVLEPTGYAIHFIGTADHFALQDARISPIHFLRYTDAQWERIAGNEFTYCNRLRQSELRTLFTDAGFRVVREEADVDTDAMQALRDGAPLDPRYVGFAPEDLSATEVRVALKSA